MAFQIPFFPHIIATILVNSIATLSLAGQIQAIGEKSYNQVAMEVLPASLVELKVEIEALNDKTLPHNVKVPQDVRKMVVRSRDFVDLFAYALPNENNAFLEYRKHLDVGYEVLGKYKDLWDIQKLEDTSQAKYDSEETQKKLSKVLKWK